MNCWQPPKRAPSAEVGEGAGVSEASWLSERCALPGPCARAARKLGRARRGVLAAGAPPRLRTTSPRALGDPVSPSAASCSLLQEVPGNREI